MSQSIVFGDSVVIASAAAGPTSVDVPTLFRCNCTDEPHPERPAGAARGCGAWWVARVVTAGTGFRLVPELQYSVRQATKTVSDALAQSATTVTTAAEKWIPGVTALLGLSGLATVVVSRDTVSAFDTPLRWLLFGLVCAAILAAGSATITAYRAAYGWPKNILIESQDNVLAAAATLNNRAVNAAGKLNKAVLFAAFSTVTLLGALGILWIAPAASNKPTATLAFTTADTATAPTSSRCVEILSISNESLRAKVLAGGPTDTISVPLSRVVKLESASCEGK